MLKQMFQADDLTHPGQKPGEFVREDGNLHVQIERAENPGNASREQKWLVAPDRAICNSDWLDDYLELRGVSNILLDTWPLIPSFVNNSWSTTPVLLFEGNAGLQSLLALLKKPLWGVTTHSPKTGALTMCATAAVNPETSQAFGYQKKSSDRSTHAHDPSCFKAVVDVGRK